MHTSQPDLLDSASEPEKEFKELIELFSRPRPNGSRAEQETSQAIQDWLEERDIPFRIQNFRHYPYYFEWIGLWLILTRGLLALAIWLRWGWVSLPLAILGVVGATVDHAFHVPLVTWIGARRGENILIEFGPRNPEREIVFSAHYDSKTELLDHNQRMFFLKSIPWGIGLTLLVGLLGPLEAYLAGLGSTWAQIVYWSGVIFSIPLLFLAGGLGLNLALGRFIQPSQGSVDNGTACVILLCLAQRLKAQAISTEKAEHTHNLFSKTKITLALFTGEEVNLQGSRAYARQRSAQKNDQPLPTAAINLEVMAQDGDYVFWEKDGSVFKLEPTDQTLNEVIKSTIEEVTGKQPIPGGPIISDGASFMAEGVPTGVLGTYHSRLKDSGFHKPTDNPSRVAFERLPEGVEILIRIAHKLDSKSI
jgi:hypothetical protein